MKTLLLLAALSTATPALAELPLNAIYGTPEACKLYAIGGADEVLSRGYEEFLVTNSQAVSFEDICYFTSSTLGRVSMACVSEVETPVEVWVNIRLAGDILIVEGPSEKFALHPCSASETPLM